jgi:3-isopropylmalate/(R)-2-methylmalate dehydratase small subunit
VKPGRVWKFGASINTDLMLPGHLLLASPEEQKRALFALNRPGWVDQVTPGDIIVAGPNFGTGSSRPAPRSMRNLGIACLLAESINGLFFRNSVNMGFVALDCPGVDRAFAEGHVAEVSIERWTVRNRDTGQVLPIPPIPEPLLALMLNGGMFPYLEKQGLIRPRGPAPPGGPS